MKKIAALSGGEKARVSLAKLMLLNANVLILDEPTNHLDLYSKEVLEGSLLDYEGTLLFISHDRYFLNKMAESILELSPHGIEGYLGNYDDYIDKKQELAEIQAQLQTEDAKSGGKSRGSEDWTAGRNSGAAAAGSAVGAAGKLPRKDAAPADGGSAGKPASFGTAGVPGSGSATPAPSARTADYEAGKMAKREERGRQRRLEQLENDIAGLEAEVSELEAELTVPEVYQNYLLVQEKQAAIGERKERLEALYEEWTDLLG